jgi:hypothetical protein
MQQNKPSGKLKLSLVAIAVSQIFSLSAYAAQTERERIAELEKKLEKSLTLIEKLSTRLSQVEGSVTTLKLSTRLSQAEDSKTTPPVQNASAEKIATQDERIEQLEKNLLGVSDNAAHHNQLGLPIHGFAAIGYEHSANDPSGRKSGFTLGNVDFYLTPQLGDRVKSLIELNFEYGEAGTLSTDLERMQFGYTFDDALTVWAGRFHTPYGYWHTAYHHGPQIQTSVDRPRFLAFEDEGGILPSHTVGLLASGSVRTGGGRLRYDAFIGNGGRILDKVLDFNAVKDDNQNKAVGGNLNYSFGGALDGLTLGAHALSEQIDGFDGSALTSSTKFNTYGAYAFVERDNWEILSEYYRFRNKDLSGGTGTHSSWAGFAQVAYKLGTAWTPYVRYEKASLDQTDSYFANLESGHSYKRNVVGLRYDLNPVSAVKVEWNQTREQLAAEEQKVNKALVQFTIGF